MRLKSVWLYCLVFLSALILFVYLLFPERELAQSLSHTLTNQDAGIRVQIDRVKPALLPFGLKFINADILLDNGTKITPQSTQFFLNPLFLFKRQKKIRFQSALYGGAINGSLIVEQLHPLEISAPVLFVSQVQVREFRFNTDMGVINLTCQLNGDYAEIDSKKTTKKGHGTIRMHTVSAQFMNPLFTALNLPVIDFSDIKLNFTHHQKTVHIDDGKAVGPMMTIHFKGTIDIDSPVRESRLDLVATVWPTSVYFTKLIALAGSGIGTKTRNQDKTGISFNINGTLKSPGIDP
jgi:type II secretion system protein N